MPKPKASSFTKPLTTPDGPDGSADPAHVTLEVLAGSRPKTVKTSSGQELTPPADWALLKPGDAGLTRRVKAAGPSWTVRQLRRGRMISLGVWAPRVNIDQAQAALAAERETPQYKMRRQADATRRDQKQHAYVEEFNTAVLQFLNFAPIYQTFAEQLAEAVTTHATPVGSGTVARTSRIPVERRAEAAVIAWMRHQTTSYDHMQIARIKGRRREVRRMLAEKSQQLLQAYRLGSPQAAQQCPLQTALRRAGLPETVEINAVEIHTEEN